MLRNQITSHLSLVAKLLLVLLFLMDGGWLLAQEADLSFLKQKCPKLTEMYQEELGRYHSQYVFAIDVSGTMNKYKNDVQPALQEFFAALPDGDKVTVIPFGTQAADLMDLSGKIDAQVRRSLVSNIDKLYDNPNYEKDMKQCTDIEKACQLISKKVNLSTDYKNNVIIILTDFRNDDGVEKKLSMDQLERMDQDFAAASQGMYTRVVALDLATAADKQKPGYCLDQLKEYVFYATSNGMEIVSLTNPGPQIQQWFTELKREIMVEKMRAIIDNENRIAPARLKTKINIDGDVDAHITWTPTKLYPMMKIGKTTVSNGNFVFVDDTTLWQNTTDTVLDLELGQLKHKSWGFHKLNDSLCLGIDLPTEYDAELQWLKVTKPLPNTNTKESRLIFSFFLPLWLSVCLAILILIYILMFFKAIARNSKERFVGTVDILEGKRGRPIGPTIDVKAKSSQTLLIGDGGNCGCDISGANWTIKVEKKTSSPFLVWKRPAFEWSAKAGLIRDGKNKKRGLLGRYKKNNMRRKADLECLSGDSENISHYVSIKIK